MAGTVARGQINTSTDLADMRAQHDGDPAALKSAYTGYRANMQAAYGDNAIGQTMLANADQTFAQHYDSLVNQKARVDTSNARDDILAQIQSDRNDMSQMAASGVTGGPLFEQKQAHLTSAYSQLEANPLFGMPKAVVDNMRQDAANGIKGDAILSSVDATVKDGGSLVAQKTAYDSIDKAPGFSNSIGPWPKGSWTRVSVF